MAEGTAAIAPPEVSVIVPAYRAAGFCHRAIDSALGQEGVVIEVVVVDDASPDDTADAVGRRYTRDSRVRVERLAANGGPAAARNHGFDRARGEWLAVLDADDAFLPGRIAALLAAARALDADIVADAVRLFDAAAGEAGPPAMRLRAAAEPLDLHGFVARARPGTDELDYGLMKPMFRRAFLDRHRLRYPAGRRHGEDVLLMIDALLAGARLVVAPVAGYLWTTRGSGMSRTVVDYRGQVCAARALARDPRVRGDRRLAALLRERAAALRRLDVERRFDAARGSRRRVAAALVMLRHPFLARRLLGEIGRRRQTP